MPKYFVIREIGAEDSKQFAVVTHGEGYDGKWKRQCLWVHDWFVKEDDARAFAHHMEYPD
jgi:hypothetical protein